MRYLNRNKRPVWYAELLRKKAVTRPGEDGEELETGEFEYIYSPPCFLMANISAASGQMSEEVFGRFTDYSRTLVLPDCPLVEGMHVWAERDTAESPNYIVTKVAHGLNGWVVALKELAGHA